MLKLISVRTRKFPPNFIGGEKMFWTGLIIGLFIGANVGLFVFALIAAKKESVSCFAEIETNGNVQILQRCEEVRT
jgi:hypothetical protein